VTEEERTDVLAAKLEALRELVDERDHRYEDRFRATDEKTSLALTSSEKAVSKAEIATEKRFDSVNEFRGQLKDQTATLLPRVEADAKFKNLEDKIEANKAGSVVASRWTMDKVVIIAVAVVGWVLLLWRSKP
jgi:hypothetical protein